MHNWHEHRHDIHRNMHCTRANQHPNWDAPTDYYNKLKTEYVMLYIEHMPFTTVNPYKSRSCFNKNIRVDKWWTSLDTIVMQWKMPNVFRVVSCWTLISSHPNGGNKDNSCSRYAANVHWPTCDDIHHTSGMTYVKDAWAINMFQLEFNSNDHNIKLFQICSRICTWALYYDHAMIVMWWHIKKCTQMTKSTHQQYGHTNYMIIMNQRPNVPSFQYFEISKFQRSTIRIFQRAKNARSQDGIAARWEVLEINAQDRKLEKRPVFPTCQDPKIWTCIFASSEVPEINDQDRKLPKGQYSPSVKIWRWEGPDMRTCTDFKVSTCKLRKQPRSRHRFPEHKIPNRQALQPNYKTLPSFQDLQITRFQHHLKNSWQSAKHNMICIWTA